MASQLRDLPEVRARLKPTLILVRHGQTKFDRPPDTHQGWDNTGLDKTGVTQGKHIAQVLSSLPIQRVYTSDLKRAAETAGMIWDGQNFKGGLSGRFGLRPWNVGALVGKAKKDVKAELEHYEFDKPEKPLPGGESFRSFTERYLTQFKALLEIAKEHPEEGVVVAVTHSWNFAVSLAWLSAGADRSKLDEEVLKAGKDILPDAGGGIRITWRGTRWEIKKLPTVPVTAS